MNLLDAPVERLKTFSWPEMLQQTWYYTTNLPQPQVNVPQSGLDFNLPHSFMIHDHLLQKPPASHRLARMDHPDDITEFAYPWTNLHKHTHRHMRGRAHTHAHLPQPHRLHVSQVILWCPCGNFLTISINFRRFYHLKLFFRWIIKMLRQQSCIDHLTCSSLCKLYVWTGLL